MERLILGAKAMYTEQQMNGLNGNILVCGASGVGKTTSIVEPRLLNTTQESLIVTVSKRKLVQKYTPYFQKMGYRVLDFNLCDPAGSSFFYDPLSSIKNCRDIVFLAESIVMSDTRKTGNKYADPFFDQAAISLLTAEIGLVLSASEHPSFSEVVEINNGLEFYETESKTLRTSLDHLFDAISEGDPNNFSVTAYNSFRRNPIRTASCVFSSLNTCLDKFASPEMLQALKEKRSIDISQIGKKKTVLFITASPVNESMAAFTNLFYANAFKSLFEFAESQGGELPVPVHIIADDFSSGAMINRFPQYISIIREKKISVMVAFQSFSQLESLYEQGGASTIKDNCDTLVYLGGNDVRTAKEISERLDCPLSDILTMEVGKEYVFQRGKKPVFTERYDIFNDEAYIALTKPSKKDRGTGR